ncbi:small conductance mechanosensitive channel [Leucobacter exalbidus]|uniref:Small conductance mechanosensitive channel n=1 Tax=Leucobacter exalbidus TaxID=662960 RepID=A0A940PTD3_9MICO|nr:mechanosensitive ion channel family protein [Leucobacter exalbidus]MBP1324894.1 small conductance mechanosensitive channel [Leucobacter exalbidus]
MDDVTEEVTEEVTVATVASNAVSDFFVTFQTPITVIIIIVAAIAINWVLRRLLMRAVTQIVRGVKKAQDVDTTSEIHVSTYIKARAVQRTRTLGTVGRAVITWAVVVVALILILGQLGVDLAALLTSAGIVAAGLAFGAQNIVKDILNGIFMVFEDQLGVGDVITVGEINGTVEDVGIRVTQVRALDGTLWFVRNGEILTLGNASQGWGRAVLDMTVSTDNDMAKVEEAAMTAAKSLLTDHDIARKVTGEPEVWGVESAFGDRATLRLAMRTRPEAQWAVQRALRSALMREFAKNDIKLADKMPDFPGGAA